MKISKYIREENFVGKPCPNFELEFTFKFDINILLIKFSNSDVLCELGEYKGTYPITTIVKSSKFQPFLKYAPGCIKKPYAMIFMMHSAVKITKKMYSIFS